MSSQLLQDKCASCGNSWESRKDESYRDLGSKSISKIHGIIMGSNFYKKNIQLYFCDKHFTNPGFRNVIRYVNGTGVLQIRNVITKRWRNAEKIGVVVA